MTLDIDVKHRGKAFWVKGFLEGDSYSPVIRKRFTAKEDAVSYATGLVGGYGPAVRQLGRPGWVMSDDTADDGYASYDFARTRTWLREGASSLPSATMAPAKSRRTSGHTSSGHSHHTVLMPATQGFEGVKHEWRAEPDCAQTA